MNIKTISALFIINIILLIVFAYVANLLLVAPKQTYAFDFYPHYVGGQTAWQGNTPYDPAVTEQIQMGMFGRLLPPEADQQNMAYPAYSSVMLAPVLILPAQTALSVWIALQFLALLWTPIIWLVIVKWKPHPLLLGALMFGLLFVFRYPIDTLTLAQFSGTVVFALSLGVFLLIQRRDVLAGLVMTMATVPPTLGAPLALALLLALALGGRWRGFLAFLATLAVMIAVSLLLIGNWLPAYFEVLNAYQEYAEVAWSVQTLAWLPLQAVYVLALLALSLFMLWRYLKQADTTRYIDLATTAFIVVLLLLPVTGEYYLVLLIPPMIVIVSRSLAYPLTVRLLVAISVTLALFSPWLYQHGDALASLLIPLHVLLTWLFVYALPVFHRFTAADVHRV